MTPSLIYLGLIAQFFLAGEKINDPLAMYAGDIMTVLDTLLSFVDFTFLFFELCSEVPADMKFCLIWCSFCGGKAWCSGESCLTESPGRGFEAASPQILRGKACLGFSLPQTPLVWEPPALGLPFLWCSFCDVLLMIEI
jgi:hypothetical protein